MFQANQAFQQIVEASGGIDVLSMIKDGLGEEFFAFIVGIIIFGGIKSIGKVTERLVPFMGLVLFMLLSNNNF